MRGYILIEDKVQLVPDGIIQTRLDDVIKDYYYVKDNFWDVVGRNEVIWEVLNLKNGKTYRLRSYKTDYPGWSKIDEEVDNQHRYTKTQIKQIGRVLNNDDR